MILPAWILMLLAVPVLLTGESLVRRIGLLSRFNIPAPVVGGLLVSLGLLTGNVSGWFRASFEITTTAQWWTWVVTAEPERATSPAKNVNLPFLVAFFACIGLNASWSLVRSGSLQIVKFLLLSAALAVIQNLLGVALSGLLGVSPLLGLVCGAVTLTGGHATALGFAPDLEKAGLPTAPVAGMAAATFGLVTGGLFGGPVGGRLIRKRQLQPGAALETHYPIGQPRAMGILHDFRALGGFGRSLLLHLLLLLLCVKLGAWVSHFLKAAGFTFPVAMGAMLLAVTIRNAFDLAGARWIRTEIIDVLASVALGVFLTTAMMTLTLLELAHTAVPMLIILAAQVAVMVWFACFITFRVMGRDYEAAIMSGGHVGFGLGATSTAVANMQALVQSFGPAPRAFLVVPLVGGFLVDFLNALNITGFINLVK